MALEERNIEQFGGIIERNKACEVVNKSKMWA